MQFNALPRALAAIPLSLLLAGGLSACAGLQRPPEPGALEALPVIRLGQPKPVQGEYIVHLPASEPVTTTATVQGTLFEQADSKTLQVRLKQDLYLYKQWLSNDRRHWVRATDAVRGNASVELPSWERPQAGQVLIELDTLPGR